jgi:glycosyltransferase involved in cell wall biosynthesis
MSTHCPSTARGSELRDPQQHRRAAMAPEAPSDTPGMVSVRPRVLQVLFSFRVGGSEIFGLELSRQLVEGGVEVLCGAIDGTPGPLLGRCLEYGIKPVDLGIPRNILGRNGISVHLVRRMQELRPDAVHLQHFLGLNKLGIPARIARVPRIIVTEHSVKDVDQSWRGRIRARLSWRLATKITVIHSSIRDYLCNYLGLPAERVEVIPIGIEIEKYHRQDRDACRARLGLGPQVVFVFAGRLAAVKNVPGLIAAFLEVQSQGAPEATLLVVGDGEERATCDELVRSHPCGSRVRLVGLQMDARPFVAAADVFILNSRSEGTPRALLEAMAMGLPGLCPAVGGIPEILAGRGWLTAPNDARSLREAIRFVLDHPEQITSFGVSCRAYVRSHFDSRPIAARYRELLVGGSP